MEQQYLAAASQETVFPLWKAHIRRKREKILELREIHGYFEFVCEISQSSESTCHVIHVYEPEGHDRLPWPKRNHTHNLMNSPIVPLLGLSARFFTMSTGRWCLGGPGHNLENKVDFSRREDTPVHSINYAPLNAHLHRIQRFNTLACLKCAARSETVIRLHLHCVAFHEARVMRKALLFTSLTCTVGSLTTKDVSPTERRNRLSIPQQSLIITHY